MRVKSAVRCWDKVNAFLDACISSPEERVFRLDVRKPSEYRDLDCEIERLSEDFGEPIRDADGTSFNWFLAQPQAESALERIDAIGVNPLDELGRQSVFLHFKVANPRLKSPDGHIIGHQGAEEFLCFEGEPDRRLGENYIHGEFGGRSFFYTFLSFPYESLSVEFENHARFVEQHYPCRISRKTWKVWSLTKTGKSYVGRKRAAYWLGP